MVEFISLFYNILRPHRLARLGRQVLILLTAVQIRLGSHMKIKNPKLQTTDEMVVSLLSNTNSRLITTVDGFNKKTEKQENLMLAFAQIILALSY